MKKVLLSIFSVASFAVSLTAQVAPDMGFETWSAILPPIINTQDPAGWASLNALTAVGTAQSVFKETTGPAAGTATAKIVTVKVNGATLPNPYGGTLDTAGILAVGKITTSPSPALSYGFGYASRPASLAFKSKYSPVGSDSAFVLAYMTHYAGGGHTDTVGSGKFGTGTASGSYGVNSLTMNYKAAFMSVLPDSMRIFISSSVYSHDGAKIGSTFYIDSLTWSGYVGINEIDGVKNTVTVYPNPASNKISLKCSAPAKSVDVIDITGRKVGNYPMTNSEVSIETNSFTPGLYLYTIIDNDKKVINRGKFEVAH